MRGPIAPQTYPAEPFLTRGLSAGWSGSLARLPRIAIAALLALVVVAGFAWRAHQAASPYLALQSRDELAFAPASGATGSPRA
jgi:hypothetical protein